MGNILKRKAILPILGCLLVIGIYKISLNTEAQLGSEAFAATANSAVASDCTDPTASAFTAGATTTTTWSAPAAGSAGTCSSTVALSSAVNSEANPSATCTLNATGGGTGKTVTTYQTPKQKLAALQCQALSNAKLEVNGDGTDNTSHDIAISNLADSDTIYTSGDKVDDAASGAKDVLFGTSGQISTDNLSDGSDDDSATNGEVVFGGSSEGTGGSEIHIETDVTNYNVSSGTDTETLTFTTTAS